MKLATLASVGGCGALGVDDQVELESVSKGISFIQADDFSHIQNDPRIELEYLKKTLAEESGLVFVHANAHFPKDRNIGVTRGEPENNESLTVFGVQPNGWAEMHTPIGQYIGWRFTKINYFGIKSEADFDRAMKSLSPGDSVTFTLQRPKKNKKHRKLKVAGHKVKNPVKGLAKKRRASVRLKKCREMTDKIQVLEQQATHDSKKMYLQSVQNEAWDVAEDYLDWLMEAKMGVTQE